TTDPDPSVILDLNPDDVNDATGGLLLPRVKLTDLTLPNPFSTHKKGLTVYNLTISTGNGLNEGIYYNNGEKWFPVISDENVNPTIASPVIFLRQPGFLWLGINGELTDTLGFELAAEDKTRFTYQWYKRDSETLLSTAIAGATRDTLFIGSSNREDYGITDEGKVYQFYCVVVSGSQYGISGTGRVVYGPGVRLANDDWIKVANANLGVDQDMSLAGQITYEPSAIASGVNDKDYDFTVYGDWYQWGRKKDGHQKREVLATNTVSTYLNTTGGVETSKLDDADGQIKSSETALYDKFIQRNAGTFDWRQYPETTENSAAVPANAWTWDNPVNDPCRSELGAPWRVPTQAEWAQIASNNTWIWQDGGGNGISGYLLKPGGANKPTALFLPAAGARSRGSGAQANVGSLGNYWSSTVTSTSAYALYFTSGSITAAYTYGRTSGLTIRCVQKTTD
ncbi:MAG: fibrobacter succinogenes major paralogous domain-containing protein, partial [Dysgonamonadaceae bacterium]|nr:fibrobacter succinogenes major paralogous domain-containing protein [Dysgonamonadaceae bacterium]